MFTKTLLGLRLKQKLKVDEMINYANAPLCKYNKGNCICKRQLESGPFKCFYKKGPDQCCFEMEETKAILEKSKS